MPMAVVCFDVDMLGWYFGYAFEFPLESISAAKRTKNERERGVKEKEKTKLI